MIILHTNLGILIYFFILNDLYSILDCIIIVVNLIVSKYSGIAEAYCVIVKAIYMYIYVGWKGG